MVMFMIKFILLVMLFLAACNLNAQVVYYDEVVFEMQKYGYLEYAMPIERSYDTLVKDYTDTAFVWIQIDSVKLDPAFASQFDFLQITENIWVSHTSYYDTGRTIINNFKWYDTATCAIYDRIDTTKENTMRDVLILHIIPQMDIKWVGDSTSKIRPRGRTVIR